MRKHEHSWKMSTTAFTLVEVMVAAALLIMTLALFGGTFVLIERLAMNANPRLNAIQNARTAMETALSYRYNDTQLSNGYHSQSIVISGVTNSYSYYVATITQTPILVKNIYVTNQWTNPGATVASKISLAGSISFELHN